ncbi:MAG: chromate transporter [Oscillospiraceae bacterium]|nr:chromate transporter [Oscillospiraceae bacterium]
MKKYLDIFLAFFRVGGLTFGGGLAMLPILEREMINDSHQWLTKEEISDYYALAQCAPGIIAINTSVLCGNHIAGVIGGIVAALGVVVPSIIVILVIASVLNNFMSVPMVASALMGIRAGVCALILKTVLNLSKKNVVDSLTMVVFLVALAALTFVDVSPVLPVIAGAVVGIGTKCFAPSAKKEGEK